MAGEGRHVRERTRVYVDVYYVCVCVGLQVSSYVLVCPRMSSYVLICPLMSSYVAGESAFVNALEIHNLQAFDHLLPSSVRAQETGKSRTHLSV